jgi:hypothetical protein
VLLGWLLDGLAGGAPCTGTACGHPDACAVAGKPVSAENAVTSCDLPVFVDEPAEPISPERPDGSAATRWSAASGSVLIE